MATSDILDTAQRLGAKLRKVTVCEWAGPCPRCGGTDRFAVNTARGLWNCRTCHVGGDGVALVRHVANMSFREAFAFVGDPRATDAIAPHGTWGTAPPWRAFPDPDKVASALRLWSEADDPRGTRAEAYLNMRGLALGSDVAGRVLKWHPGTGCLIGLFGDVLTGVPTGISRTFLSPDGRKIGRKFLGVVGGAAIQFDQPRDELTVGEGIETALTARAFGLGPTWACGSAGAIGRLPVVPGVERLRILVERDDNGASERHAVACAVRWEAAGRKVAFKLPPPRCGDLNDAVRQDRRVRQ